MQLVSLLVPSSSSSSHFPRRIGCKQMENWRIPNSRTWVSRNIRWFGCGCVSIININLFLCFPNFRIMGIVFEWFSRYPSVLRCSILWMHVDIWGRILHYSRFFAATFLPNSSVLLYCSIHACFVFMFVDTFVPWMFQGSRTIHASSDYERIVSAGGRLLCTFCSRAVWMLRWLARLDAKLGAQ